MVTEEIYFSMHITPSEFERYYRGTAAQVLVRAHDGRSIQIPAANLRRFVTHEGIRGHFRLVIDDQHRLVDLQRL